MSIKTVKHFTPDYTISGSTMMHGFAISALAGFLASIVGENPLALRKIGFWLNIDGNIYF